MGFWRRWLGNQETAWERVERRAGSAEKKLRLAGMPLDETNTIIELKRATALISAAGALNIQIDPQLGKIDPEIGNPALIMISRYRDAMQGALALKAINRIEAATRDAAIFHARRTLLSSLPSVIILTVEKVAIIDGCLGFPPIDPSLGLNKS